MSAGEKKQLSIQNIHMTSRKTEDPFPLLVIGKPFDNKHCDKYQRHLLNIYVKGHKIPFINSDFRN